MNDLLEGAAAGLIATGPMTWTMWAADNLLPRHAQAHLPPQQITDKVLANAELKEQLDRPQRDLLATAAHYAFGTGAGSLLGLVVKKSPLPAPVTGALVGSAVWAGSYLGWLPALGIRKTAARDYPARNLQMVAAHLVWGAVAGALIGAGDRLTPHE